MINTSWTSSQRRAHTLLSLGKVQIFSTSSKREIIGYFFSNPNGAANEGTDLPVHWKPLDSESHTRNFVFIADKPHMQEQFFEVWKLYYTFKSQYNSRVALPDLPKSWRSIKLSLSPLNNDHSGPIYFLLLSHNDIYILHHHVNIVWKEINYNYRM